MRVPHQSNSYRQTPRERRSSGSPVFNLNGEVVGIVSRLMSRSGGSEGLAFATASNTAKLPA